MNGDEGTTVGTMPERTLELWSVCRKFGCGQDVHRAMPTNRIPSYGLERTEGTVSLRRLDAKFDTIMGSRTSGTSSVRSYSFFVLPGPSTMKAESSKL